MFLENIVHLYRIYALSKHFPSRNFLSLTSVKWMVFSSLHLLYFQTLSERCTILTPLDRASLGPYLKHFVKHETLSVFSVLLLLTPLRFLSPRAITFPWELAWSHIIKPEYYSEEISRWWRQLWLIPWSQYTAQQCWWFCLPDPFVLNHEVLPRSVT